MKEREREREKKEIAKKDRKARRGGKYLTILGLQMSKNNINII